MVRTGLGATEAEQAPADVPVYDDLADAVVAILKADAPPAPKAPKTPAAARKKPRRKKPAPK